MGRRVVVHVHNTRGKDSKAPVEISEGGASDPISEQVSSGEVEPDIGASEDRLGRGRAALDSLIKEYGGELVGQLLAEYGVSKVRGEPGVGSSVGLTKNGDFVKVAAGTKPSTARDAAPHKCKCGAHKK